MLELDAGIEELATDVEAEVEVSVAVEAGVEVGLGLVTRVDDDGGGAAVSSNMELVKFHHVFDSIHHVLT